MNQFELTPDKLFPAQDFMLVEPVGGETLSKSGLIIQQGSSGAVPTMGKVLRAGPNAPYKVDAILLFRRYSVDEIIIRDAAGEKKLSWVQTEDVISEYKDNGTEGN